MTNTPEHDHSKNLNQFNKFLQNNSDFLKEKYLEYFLQPFPFSELQTKQKIQQTIKFMYDVFSFEKYQKDQKMNFTLKKSLRQNILHFFKKEQSKSDQSFTSDVATKLLKFCIQQNQMFAVHYDKKEKKVELQQNSQQKIQHQTPENQQSSPQNQKIQPNQQNHFEETQNKIQLNFSNVSRKSKQSVNQPVDSVTPLSNQFSISNKSDQQKKNYETLKKQAKIVFDFYCKQQLNAGGPNATFDKISHQSNTMTLGKFMAFANITRILYQTNIKAYRPKDHQVLDKKTINECFRKISKAQRQIDFDQFFELLKVLNQVDSSVYGKLNMNKSQAHNKILRKLKYLNTPFNMKSHLEQQLHAITDQKPYVPINTAHSGKFQTSLKQDIQERKQKLKLLPHHPYPNPNPIKLHGTFLFDSQLKPLSTQHQLMESKIKGSNVFFLNRKGQSKTTTENKPELSKIRLQNSKISFENGHKIKEQVSILQRLIVVDDDNDNIFLKDYRIPKLNSNAGLKKSINSLSVSKKNSEDGKFQGRGLTEIKTQRKNVVNELKQRILEVEKGERNHFTGINHRRSISNYDIKY